VSNVVVLICKRDAEPSYGPSHQQATVRVEIRECEILAAFAAIFDGHEYLHVNALKNFYHGSFYQLKRFSHLFELLSFFDPFDRVLSLKSGI
jgi:hypothetical protein